MAHIILTGATGTAGAAILSSALQSPAISRISILSRRPVKQAEGNAKANVIVHNDFTTYPSDVLTQLQGATACIWAQGTSSRGMKEDEYVKITVDYPLAAARAFATLGSNMNFIYMSGEGADLNKTKGGMMFARVKGRAEKELLELQMDLASLDIYIVRPGVINPGGSYQAERKTAFTDKGISMLGGVFEKVYPSMVISTDSLARVCVELAVGDGKPIPLGTGVEEDGRLLRNTALRKMAASKK